MNGSSRADTPLRRLVPTSDGFRLEGPGSEVLIAAGSNVGWRLDRGGPEWSLRQERRCRVLRDADGRERARWTGDSDDGSGVTGSILADDGRLFRVVLRGGARAVVELTGWEVEGAYWSARPAERGWELTRTAAGSELPDTERALEIVFAAALADPNRSSG